MFFQPERPMKSVVLLSEIKWYPNGAQANKQGYEQQHEVLKRNELFAFPCAHIKMKKLVRDLYALGG